MLEHSLKWIIDFLTSHADQILLTKANLEQGSIRDQALLVATEGSSKPGADIMPERWHSTYTSCKSIPKYYIAHWLVSGPCDLPQQFIDTLDGVHPSHGLRRLFAHFTGLDNTTWWAPSLHVRKVLTSWLDKQYTRMCGDDRRSALHSISRNFRNADIRFEDLFPFEMEFMSKSSPGNELNRMDKDEEPDTADMLIKSIKHKFFDIEVSCSCIQGARFAVASMLGCDISVVGFWVVVVVMGSCLQVDLSAQFLSPNNFDINLPWHDMSCCLVNTANPSIKPTVASFFGKDCSAFNHMTKIGIMATAERCRVDIEHGRKDEDIGARTDILQSASTKKVEAMKEARSKRAPPKPAAVPLVLSIPSSKRVRLTEKVAVEIVDLDAGVGKA